jgi:hypothetical protein
VRARGVSKAQAIILLLEFWSSKGFIQHEASLNRVVLRRNGYGSLGAWISSNFVEDEVRYESVPMQIVALIQIRPDYVIYDVMYCLVGGIEEKTKGDFSRFAGKEVAEFTEFLREWTRESGYQID